MKPRIVIRFKLRTYVEHFVGITFFCAVTTLIFWIAWQSLNPLWDPRYIRRRFRRRRKSDLVGELLYEMPPLLRAPLLALPGIIIVCLFLPSVLRGLHRLLTRTPAAVFNDHGITGGSVWSKSQNIAWANVSKITITRPRFSKFHVPDANFTIKVHGKTRPSKWRRNRMTSEVAYISSRYMKCQAREVSAYLRNKRPDLFDDITLPTNIEFNEAG